MSELPEIEFWCSQMKEAKFQRNRAIIAARVKGASLRQLSRATGMTHQGVAKLLRRDALAEEGGAW